MKPTYFTSSATIEDKENLTTSKGTTKTKNVTSAIETSAASIITTITTTTAIEGTSGNSTTVIPEITTFSAVIGKGILGSY